LINVTSAPIIAAAPSELAANNLMKAYHGRQVVKDVSLKVQSGEVVGLLGPNGAGKTTTFYMIVGLVPSDDGTIFLDGKEVNRLPIHKRARMGLSYLPQEASVFRKLTVEENIQAVLELQIDAKGKKIATAEIADRLENLLTELQIQHIRSNTALSLSGGVDASKSPERLPHPQDLFCWTNHSPVSTQLR
jgi:lipopolysaccharide export system ATP-binding protein